MIQENEIPKYLKQRESNISKAKKKSKHKHHYEECLIQHPFSFAGKTSIQTQLCSYCTICGKIGDRLKDSIVKDYRRIVDTPIGRYYSTIPSEELYERYNDKLPVFFVEDIWKDEYVNLEQTERNKTNEQR